VRGVRRLGPNLMINLVFLTGFAAADTWWLYFVLWILPTMTWELFISRIRNIGEHGAVGDKDNRQQNTRTTPRAFADRAIFRERSP
jgi:hypothetical protein